VSIDHIDVVFEKDVTEKESGKLEEEKRNSENFLFLAHLVKGNVSFCHHLASVNFSHFNLLF